jgi:hypothetical protein
MRTALIAASLMMAATAIPAHAADYSQQLIEMSAVAGTFWGCT